MAGIRWATDHGADQLLDRSVQRAGTSMATPHVAGVAALLFAQGRVVDDVEQAILTTAVTPGAGARGFYPPAYGYGVVDALAAVKS